MVIAKSKKVKPIMNNTIKNMDYTWTPAPDPPNNQDAGVARAVFIPHSNSLPFEERRVTLEKSVTIGRYVIRSTPSPTNTIFECRVLSRHHAILYYDKGHFYLVDNRSSNGTFINNNRCSPAKEPHEVFSGDVVQFGIPVVENAANSEKNTFPPVVALLKLYHPDGKEATNNFNPTMSTPLHITDLYQLNNFVQEAVQREASLENRLRTLRECVERTRAEAESSWELFVGEQRLLMRVHTLEAMLAVGKQPDAHHAAQLLDDKRNYQRVAQESLRVAHEQRLALEESLERRSRESVALHQHNCALRLAATNALAELQKLAARCERKMCAARLAITTAEEREQAVRSQLPLAYSVQNGEAKMLVLSTDSNKMQEAKRGGSLEDAVRALPDYIKMLLPQHLLNKISEATDHMVVYCVFKNKILMNLKICSFHFQDTDTFKATAYVQLQALFSIKPLLNHFSKATLELVGIQVISTEGKTAKEFEIILKKNNFYNSEDREKQQAEDGDVGGGGIVDGGGSGEEKSAEPDLCTDDEKQEKQSRLNHDADHEENSSPLDGELRPDNNANSTYVEPDLGEDSPSKAGVEYANVLCVMSGLNDEIKGLRERLSARSKECAQLRAARDELLAAHEPPPPDHAEDAAAARATLADLQAQLARSALTEEANLEEIKRLAASAADMQAELAFRPTRAELDDLAALVADLRAQLAARDLRLAAVRTPHTADKAVETESVAETVDPVNISAEIDEMFRLDYDDDEETDSLATEIDRDDAAPPTEPEVDTYVKLADEERLRVTLQNGALHALEEELVRAKESWAEVAEERARLAAQVASMRGASRVPAALLAALCALCAALLYLVLPRLS